MPDHPKPEKKARQRLEIFRFRQFRSKQLEPLQVRQSAA